MVVSAAGLSALPPDADPQQLAMLAINPPTAALLLSEYVDLKPGELEAIGGDVVVVDSPDVSERIKGAVGQAELRLALDGVSGPATGVLAATLSPHGTLISFAAMSEGPMSISPLDFIFKPLTMKGFWLGHPEIAPKIAPAVMQAATMIASGRVHVPVARTYPPSKKLSHMRNAAERSFWTLPNHPPDLGIHLEPNVCRVVCRYTPARAPRTACRSAALRTGFSRKATAPAWSER